MRVLLPFILIAISLISGCMKDDMRPVRAFDAGDDGVFIACEGNFMFGNASLTYYDKKADTLSRQVFLDANGVPLGDVAQSMLMHDGLLWISVNNSGKIMIINPDNFLYHGKITGLVSPRFILPVAPDEIWVSDLYAGHISVFHSHNLEKKREIPLNGDGTPVHNAEQMCIWGDTLVCNSWSNDQFIFMIDRETYTVVDSMQTGIQPKKICLDKNGKLWVLTDGGYDGAPIGHEAPALSRIDLSRKTIECHIPIDEDSEVADMQMNATGDTLYLVAGEVYRIPTEACSLGEAFIPAMNHNYYSIGIDPDNSDIYLGDAGNFVDPGMMYRYSPQAVLVDSFECGIIPSDILFQ